MKLNPNILLTEICNQSCGYCFAKQKMQESVKKEMDLADFKKIVVFLKNNKQNEARLMGGEPTLHSQFREVVDFILSQGLKIRLFTNGLFSSELTGWLSKKGNSIKYMMNLTTPAFLSGVSSEKRLIKNNLKTLKKNAEVIVAFTIDSIDFKNGPIINFLKKNEIKSVRVGIANMPMGSNWLKWEQYKDFGLIVTSFIDELKKIGVSEISLNCGFIPCMFQNGQIDRTMERGVKIDGWGCYGKRGVFDVSTNLSIFPCFILENFKAKTIFDFKELKIAKKFLDNLLFWLVGDLFIFESCRECSYFKNRECGGPCRGWIINNSNRQKDFLKLPKTLYFEIVYRLLYLFRNRI